MKPYDSVILRSSLLSLNEITKRPKIAGSFEEGIYLSSSDLWREIKKNQTNPRVTETTLKYWLRSCSRCTPFGVFAGSALVPLGNKTQLVQNTADHHFKKVRIDTQYFSKMVTIIEKDQKVKKQVLFYPNSSLYENLAEWRYAEDISNGHLKNYKLTTVTKSPYLDLILQRAKTGAKLDSLIRLLQTSEAICFQDASDFIEELCVAQILVSGLEINISGQEPLIQLIKKLDEMEDVKNYQDFFHSLDHLLSNPFDGIDYYQQIITLLEQLTGEKVNSKPFFQVDMFLSHTEKIIDKNVINKVVEQVNNLMALARPYKNSILNDFKIRFEKKFDHAEIPLAIVMDLDSGIGYGNFTETNPGGSEWVDDLLIMNSQPSEKIIDILQHFSLSKYLNALSSQKNEIEITDEDIASMRKKSGEKVFSNGMYIMGSLTNSNIEVSNEQFTFELTGIGGPSAVNLFTRFTHGNTQLLKFAKDIIKIEENQYPDVIFAEIVHLPDPRTANVLLRPLLRKYEIPYLGGSGIAIENQIPIGDLLVSVQHNQVILRSIKYNKRVIPRLSSAHNYSNSNLPIYKFLCDVQNQGFSHTVLWDWGTVSDRKFLPKVTYKNIVVSKSRWTLTIDDLIALKTNGEYFRFFKDFSAKYQVKYIFQIDGDNKLLIDLNHKPSVQILINLILKKKMVQLEECLTSSENCIIHDTKGNPFANEVIIPVANTDKPIKNYTLPIKNITTLTKFLPASDWLYYKLYSGVFTQEKLLTDHLYPFIKTCTSNNHFEKFFFVRYVDDRPHIRLRLNNNDIRKQDYLQLQLTNLLNFLYSKKIVDSVVIDTYIPETTRYNPIPIEEIESLFTYDSLTTLEIITLLSERTSELSKIAIALRSVDMYLDDFRFSTNEKFEFYKNQANNFFSEFGAELNLKMQLNQKFKKSQKYLTPDIDSLQNVSMELNIYIDQLKTRSMQNQSHVNRILEVIGDDNDLKMEITSNLIHMSINRIFFTSQRKYELMIYSFLERFYHSLEARRQFFNKKTLEKSVHNQ